MSAPPKGINTLTVPGRRRRSMNTLTVPAARDGQTVANAYTLPPKDKSAIDAQAADGYFTVRGQLTTKGVFWDRFNDNTQTVNAGRTRMESGYGYLNALTSMSKERAELEEGAADKKDADEASLSLSRDRSDQWEARPKRADVIKSFLLRSLGTLGIIYGDIGTSPLYTLSTILGCNTDAPSKYQCVVADGVSPAVAEDIKSVLSVIVWALIFIVCIKYVGVAFRFDYHGEGGIFSLLLKIVHESIHPVGKKTLILCTVLATTGAAMMCGDGLITPALSVLSAVEGLATDKLFSPSGVQVVKDLFLGPSKVGIANGPITMVWFILIGGVGIYNLTIHDQWMVLVDAINPYYVYYFWVKSSFAGYGAFQRFGDVVLAVTGAEALFADMGHFGRGPIMLSWFGLVLPALIFCYTGQAAYVLSVGTQAAASNPFWSATPNALYIVMLIFATITTIIASQAMITGCFGLINMAVSLELFPRVKVVNTNPKEKAHIYIPEVNFLLGLGTIILVLAFRSSGALTGAYGVAVLFTFNMSTQLYVQVLHRVYGWNFLVAFCCLIPFMIVDGTLLVSNLYMKMDENGWVTLVIAVILLIFMLTWRYGRYCTGKAYTELAAQEGSLSSLSGLVLQQQAGTLRLSPGTGVFMSPTVEKLKGESLPAALSLYNRITNGVHQRTVLLSVCFNSLTPFVDQSQRVELERLSEHIWAARVTFGYAEPLSEVNMGVVVRDDVLPIIKQNVENDETVRRRPQAASQQLDMLFSEERNEEAEQMLAKDAIEGEQGFDEGDNLWFYMHREKVMSKPGSNILRRTVISMYAGIIGITRDPAQFFGVPMDLVLVLNMQIKRTNRVKRAARAKGRRKGKTPKNTLYQNPKAIKDDIFREKFDKHKTFLQNMDSCNLKDMYFDKLPEVIPDKAEWTLPKVNEEELSVCKKLADKYGKGGADGRGC
ncbi:putative potassium transport system protein kup 3 [Perkinsus olseni]|uniref:Putative potassium transport system protein kup 3 n=3 Tax=Perkinsus olseni TaxID=32597 RepID=A0A7J6P041_PEROL|nr:putative potassium transport system protein kup 3 [Perkinsus olseni]